jgi:hypothetical protein
MRASFWVGGDSRDRELPRPKDANERIEQPVFDPSGAKAGGPDRPLKKSI